MNFSCGCFLEMRAADAKLICKFHRPYPQTEHNSAGAPELRVENPANFGCSKLKIRVENTRKPAPENVCAEGVCGCFALMGRFRVPVFGCFEKQIPEFRVAEFQLLTTRKKHPLQVRRQGRHGTPPYHRKSLEGKMCFKQLTEADFSYITATESCCCSLKNILPPPRAKKKILEWVWICS